MTTEILMHINEDLTEEQQRELLLSYGNRPDGIHAHHQTKQPHMMFVAYDPEELCPHDLIDIAQENGVHAQLVEF